MQIERPCADTETGTQEKTPGVETEAEAGAMRLQAKGRPKESRPHPKWEEARSVLPRDFGGGAVALPTPSFRTSGLYNCERTHFCGF